MPLLLLLVSSLILYLSGATGVIGDETTGVTGKYVTNGAPPMSPVIYHWCSSVMMPLLLPLVSPVYVPLLMPLVSSTIMPLV